VAKRRNFTQELLAKRSKGAIIVISLAPHYGVPVEYKPRNAHDPEPWTAGLIYRFSGRECHALPTLRMSQFDKDTALRLVDGLYDGALQVGQDDYRFDFSMEQMVTMLVVLTAEGFLAQHADTFVLTEQGGLRLLELSDTGAPSAA
jgi:hypothetical protein